MSKVAIVGVEGSGKTVLMAAMGEMYGKASHDSLYLMPENQAAFSFMTRIPHKMRVEHQWPEATAIESMKYLKWTVRYGTEVLTELEMLDYPGELYRMAFGDRKESDIEPQKEQIHEFLEHLVTADFLIVLLNLKDAMDIGANARNNETVWLTRGIFDYAQRLPNLKKRLLVFTQADRYRHLLQSDGGAKALQEKYLPMLSILHPDLECVAISAVEAPESEAPGARPSTDGGLQELMAQIVMASETGRHALALFDKCQNAATEVTREYISISDLEQAIQQYAHALNAIGKTDAGVICAIYPGTLDTHLERQKLLVDFLSELLAVRSSNSVASLANENTWASLVRKYSDIPSLSKTIQNIIKYYRERKQAATITRQLIVAIVSCVVAIGVYFAWRSWADQQIEKLFQNTGLSHAVCESAFKKDPRAQYEVGTYFLTSSKGRDIVRALEWLKKSAFSGNAEAQDTICRLYYFAPEYMDEMPKDSDTAQWFKRLAESGSPWAQNVLGEIYSAGWGVAKDDQAALRWWIESAENGNLYGMVNVGNAKNRDAGKPFDYEEAIKWYRKAADAGFVEAQNILGFMYQDGRGVAKNDAEAAKWYQKAAEQGDSIAQINLGMMYQDGRGVAKDDAAAARWYRKAAEQGNLGAQLNLGVMYAEGRGVVANDAEAVKWIRKAADQGNSIAQRSLGVMYAEGRGVAANIAEAAKWYRKAAEQGDANAQFSLGTLYSEGRAVPKDSAAAEIWYKKAVGQFREAAERGDAWGQYELANCYYGGAGVTKDEKEAAKWYRKAADQGDANAQFSLGMMYYKRRGVAKNGATAVEWLQKAAAQGHIQAQNILSEIWEGAKAEGRSLMSAKTQKTPAVIDKKNSLENASAKTVDLAKNSDKQKEIRRQAAEADARKASEAGYEALSKGNYVAAVSSFSNALNNLPDLSHNAALRHDSAWGLAEALYLNARSLADKNEHLTEARQMVDAALKNAPDHQGAQALRKRLNSLGVSK